MSTQSCDFLGNPRERGGDGENVWDVNEYICSGVARAEGAVEGRPGKACESPYCSVFLLAQEAWMLLGYAVERAVQRGERV